MKKLHMICNAHVDPIWQWQWDEGIGVALSTFKVAADFCEAEEHFVFNHNESILYQWVLEYDPALFARIQRLVKEGKWHIMGGWYLQPDCNMPSGESILRQIITANQFFLQHFGTLPKTAVNFDTFGHSRGLVQILKAAGYHTYMFMRPDKGSGMLEELPQGFVWQGFAGTEIPAFRLECQYATGHGKAVSDTIQYIEAHPQTEVSLKPWGIGDHGGGPSQRDLAALNIWMTEKAEKGEMEILHSFPDAFFEEDFSRPNAVWAADINPMFIGSYTSMADIKKAHRTLENALYATEKLASAVACQGLLPYPAAGFKEAQEALLFAAFHDTLAGTISKTPEQEALRSMNYGLEILARIRTRAFYAIASRQPAAAEGSLPVFVYNPHPYPVHTVLECEYTLPDYNWENFTFSPLLYHEGEPVPCQTERESGNVPIEFRKRLSFVADLAPMAMERYDLCFEKVPKFRPSAKLVEEESFRFSNGSMEVEIDHTTGLVSRYATGGKPIARENFGRLVVYQDNVDPWGMICKSIPQEIGAFTLMTPAEAAEFASVPAETLCPVQVVEDGPVRTVVEALFRYHHSDARLRYMLPKEGNGFDVEVTVYWHEHDKMLRLHLPTAFHHASYYGQTMFGVNSLKDTGEEMVHQKWAAAVDGASSAAMTVINDGIHGLFCKEEGLYLSLLRSPAYAAMPVLDFPIIPADRFTHRIDQGEKVFSFRIEGGDASSRLEQIDLEAQIYNELPRAVNIFPTRSGETAPPLYQPPLQIEGGRLDAFYPHPEDGYILRVFNPSPDVRTICIASPLWHITENVDFVGYQFKTFRLASSALIETDPFGEQL